ncbi:trans-sialidase [Trypanosoma cruzi]|nr:trans-sialidase [Trypanosoma cruzi]
MPLAGQFTTFRRTHEQAISKESRAAFLMTIEVAPSTRPQYARMLRSMLEMDRTPLDMALLGVAKVCGAIKGEASAPPDKGRDESSNPQPDRLEGTCCLTTCVDNGEPLVRDCGLDPNNFTMERDGALILDWPVAPKTAKADPHRASRFVKIRGQDAFDIIKLCRTLQKNKGKLTNLTTAQEERALAPWKVTAHSIKQGALRHAAPIVETHNLDPHVISQLAKHVNPFDLPQNTV